jgi:hypothetical protein
MDKNEADLKAEELIKLSIQHKELAERIKLLKQELKDYTDCENINEMNWSADGGFVEVKTETKYKLADIPADIKVSSDVAAIDVAAKAFEPKVVLSKEGKRMFRDQYPAIVKLMIPTIKKTIKVTV